MICEHCGSEIAKKIAPEETPVVDHEPAAPGKYKVDIEINGTMARFFGPEGNLRARVFRGMITRQIFNGLKSLESPIMGGFHVGDVWVSMPRVFEMLNNQGEDRRFVLFHGNGSGGLVLEFIDGARVGKNLEYAIRGAFNKRPVPTEQEQEIDHGREAAGPEREEEHDESAGAPGTEGEGDDSEHGEPAERTEDGEVVEVIPEIAEEIRAQYEADRKAMSPEEYRLLTVQEPAPAVRPEEEPFVTIRKGGVKAPRPKQMYYRRPQGLPGR